jgi:hypothetical protein
MAIALALALIAIAFVPMVLEARRGLFEPFNPKNAFVAYLALQLGISGLVTLMTGRAAPINLDPASHYAAYVRALLVANAGLFAFLFGYYFQRSASVRLPSPWRATWISSRVAPLAILYGVVAISTFAILLRNNGGLSAFLAQRETFRAGGLIGQGYLIFPAMALGPLAVFIVLADMARRQPLTLGRRIALLSVFGLSLVPGFLLGFRSAFLLPAVQLLVLWHFAVRRLSPKLLIVSVAALGVVFTLYGISRQVPAGLPASDAFRIASDAIRVDPELITGVVSRSKGTETVAVIVHRLDQTGKFEYGWRGVVEAATILIPGRLWPGKPTPLGVRFTTYFFGDAFAESRSDYLTESWSGISPTAVGELYWHFGLVGVITGLFFLGMVTKLAYGTFVRHHTNPAVQVTYVIVFTTIAMFAEAIQGYVNTLVMFVVALAGTFTLLSIRFARPAPSTEPMRSGRLRASV